MRREVARPDEAQAAQRPAAARDDEHEHPQDDRHDRADAGRVRDRDAASRDRDDAPPELDDPRHGDDGRDRRRRADGGREVDETRADRGESGQQAGEHGIPLSP